MKNPFESKLLGSVVSAIDADSRIRMVKGFTERECLAAVKLAGLQKTVLKAIETRLKQLERAA